MSQINVSIGGKLEASFNAMFSKAGQYISNFKNTINTQLLSTLGAASMASKAIGAVTSSMRQMEQEAKSFTNIGNQFGIDPSEVAKLSKIANESGVSQRSLLKGFQTLKMEATKALADPLSKAGKTFERLNISQEQLKNGLKDGGIQEFFGSWSDAVNKIGDEGKQSSAIMDTLGQNGMRLQNVIEMGSKGQRENLDGVISANSYQIAQVKALGDMWDKVKQALSYIVEWILVGFNQALGWSIALTGECLAITTRFLSKWGLLVAFALAFVNPLMSVGLIVAIMATDAEKAADSFEKMAQYGVDMAQAGNIKPYQAKTGTVDYISEAQQADIDKARKELQDAKTKGKSAGVSDQEKLNQLLREEKDLRLQIGFIKETSNADSVAYENNIELLNKETELQTKLNDIATAKKSRDDGIATAEKERIKAKKALSEKGLKDEDLLRKLIQERLALEKQQSSADPTKLKEKIELETQRLELIGRIQDLEEKILSDKKKASEDLQKDELKRAKDLANAKAGNKSKEQDMADKIADRAMKRKGASDSEIAKAQLDREMVRLDQMHGEYNQYATESGAKQTKLNKEIQDAKDSGDEKSQNEKEQALHELLTEQETKKGELLDKMSKVNDMIPEDTNGKFKGQTFSSHLRAIGGGGGYFSTQGKDRGIAIAQKSEQHLQAIKDALTGGAGGGGRTTDKNGFNNSGKGGVWGWNTDLRGQWDTMKSGGLLNDNNY